MATKIIKKKIQDLFPKEFADKRLISKFFDYVMNNFFQKDSETYVNGYIGQKSVALEEGDFYITEKTDDRQNNQIVPLVETTDSNNNETITDFKNFISDLKHQGCLTTNQNRLFSNEYWSWSPLINVDMFLNYNYYYWLDNGIDPIKINTVTNAVKNIIGRKNYTLTYYNDDNESIDLELKSGLRIMFKDDENSEYNNKPFIVEGVGTSIQLIDDSEIFYGTDTNPDYFVMERGCIDGNVWSLRNRWFHKSVVTTLENVIIYEAVDTNNVTLYTTVAEEDVENTTPFYTDMSLTKLYGTYSTIDGVSYTGKTKTLRFSQAKMPIICFKKDLELYNYGNYNRGFVDLVTDISKADLQGHSITEIQNVKLEDGMTLLLTEDNTIYEIQGLSSLGMIVLQNSIKGKSFEGLSVKGEGIKIRSGDYADIYLYFDGESWVKGQQKTQTNQSPLFNLYDSEGILLNDEEKYESSSFEGCKIFDYKTSDAEGLDVNEFIDRVVVANEYGNYIFTNNIQSDVITYAKYPYTSLSTYEGYKYAKINGTNDYVNDWHYNDKGNYSYIVTEIKVNGNYYEIDDYKVFSLAIEPDEVENRKSIFVYVNGDLYDSYELENKELKISGIEDGDIIIIKLLKEKIDNIPSGYYFELPMALTSNPNNSEIEEIKYNQCFDQMVSIIENQNGITGTGSSNNNYNDTEKNLSLGTVITQHSAPIVKSMVLNNTSETNIMNTLIYMTNEYSKFKSRLYTVIKNLTEDNTLLYSETQDDEYYEEVCEQIFSKMNIGKDGLFSFYNNGVGEDMGECYIPSTPSYLGLDICYYPKFVTINNGKEDVEVLLCHDGSYTKLFESGDFRNNILLYIEKQIYNSINDDFKNQITGLNKFKYIPGYFRTTEYNRDEYVELLRPYFEKWCYDNNIYDYTVNNEFAYDDEMTWNWSEAKDKEGNKLFGNYKALYMYYYDTYRPHTHPWEMLGFGDKPDWWEEYYGKLPYTSDNLPMWKDIENGYIASGVRKGYHTEFIREGLIENYLPVDKDGNLLSPKDIGIAYEMPQGYQINTSWKFGDMGRYEYIWTLTSEYRYAIQTALYKMKPTLWVETNWDTENTEILFSGSNKQIVNKLTNERINDDELYIHNELVNDEYIRKIGIQQWISDYIVYQHLNITDKCGDLLRNATTKLGYKAGRFFKKDSLKIVSDNFGTIPSSDYSVKLYKSLTDEIYTYSALLVQRVDNGYMIDGFNMESPYFTIYEPQYNGKKSSIEVNNRNFIYYNEITSKEKQIKYKTIFKSIQEVYTIVCSYGRWLEKKENVEYSVNDNGEVINFNAKAKELLLWATMNPTTNSVIMLNPCCDEITFNVDGFIDEIGTNSNGYWTITNSLKKPIHNDKIDVYRGNGYTNINPTEELLTFVKASKVEYENIIIFNDETTYGNIIYDSLLNINIKRLRLMGSCINDWNGTLYSPGYLIGDNGFVSNYDKMAEDFRYAYDTDNTRMIGNFNEEAKKTIGFKLLPYMEKLFIDDRNIFDFYKGMIREKGTRSSFTKLNRSSYIMNINDNEMNLFENWILRLGRFGSTWNDSTVEVNVEPEMITHNPQIVMFSTNNTVNDDNSVDKICWDSSDFVKKADVVSNNSFMYWNESDTSEITSELNFDETDIEPTYFVDVKWYDAETGKLIDSLYKSGLKYGDMVNYESTISQKEYDTTNVSLSLNYYIRKNISQTYYLNKVKYSVNVKWTNSSGEVLDSYIKEVDYNTSIDYTPNITSDESDPYHEIPKLVVTITSDYSNTFILYKESELIPEYDVDVKWVNESGTVLDEYKQENVKEGTALYYAPNISEEYEAQSPFNETIMGDIDRTITVYEYVNGIQLPKDWGTFTKCYFSLSLGESYSENDTVCIASVHTTTGTLPIIIRKADTSLSINTNLYESIQGVISGDYTGRDYNSAAYSNKYGRWYNAYSHRGSMTVWVDKESYGIKAIYDVSWGLIGDYGQGYNWEFSDYYGIICYNFTAVITPTAKVMRIYKNASTISASYIDAYYGYDSNGNIIGYVDVRGNVIDKNSAVFGTLKI